jgi:hypothetical protein
MALAIASLCGVLGCASQAGAPSKKAGAAVDSPVQVYGAERNFTLPENEGRAVPLRRAVEQLVPTDYVVRWVDVDASRRNTPVTWHAKQEWPAAVRQAVSGASGLTVDIATGSRLVLIRQVSAGLRPHRPSSPASPASATSPPAAAASSASPPGSLPVAPTATPTATWTKPPALASTVPAVDRKARPDGAASPRPSIVSTGMRRGAAVPAASLAQAPDRSPAPAAAASRRWGLSEQDRTLKLVIERWAQEAGWRVFWELGVDYPIAATASIGGSFEEAVSVVVRSMEHADVPPKAIFYRGNQVLRMVPRGME